MSCKDGNVDMTVKAEMIVNGKIILLSCIHELGPLTFKPESDGSNVGFFQCKISGKLTRWSRLKLWIFKRRLLRSGRK